MKHVFTLEYWQDDGWYVGKLKEVPGVFSQGETLKELTENIEDASRMVLEIPETSLRPFIIDCIEKGMPSDPAFSC